MAEKRENYAFPHSAESEKAVLGAILRSPASFHQVIEKTYLKGEHFFLDYHRQIFEAMLSLDAQGKPIDYFTVSETLVKLQVPINLPFLIELVENSPISENIEYYSNIVKEKYYLRKIIKICEDTSSTARAAQGEAKDVLSEVEKEFLHILNEQDRNEAGLISAKKILETLLETLEKRMAAAGTLSGVASGFTELDKITGGWQKSDLIILAARPGMGKTALALNWAMSAVKSKPDSKVGVFTLEMSKEQLVERLLSAEGKVDSNKLRQGDMSEDDKDRLMYAARILNDLGDRLVIDETPGLSISELRARSRRFKREHGLDLIIIDYLQLMTASQTAQRQGREREISEISTSLKALAKEIAIPVIACAQLNRSPDARPDKRPKMSDLRESGAMEQDADLIMFIYRDDYYNPESEDAGKSEILLAKNRHGETGKVYLAWHPHFVSFYNLIEE
ncbi:MAG: replicative DNA helicase [Deltaproteobacteria bacterium]|nr:replicative DNA helicase [Deltaproteobacteria bacterium]